VLLVAFSEEFEGGARAVQSTGVSSHCMGCVPAAQALHDSPWPLNLPFVQGSHREPSPTKVKPANQIGR
jgi:hypothetical protein